VYGLGAGFLGFFALALPELNVISSSIQTMMPILDDIMLRIHTVLIISSYAVITLAFVVANCYLVVSAHRDRSALARGVIGAEIGIGAKVTLAVLAYKYDSLGIARPSGGWARIWDFLFSDPINAGTSALWGFFRRQESTNEFDVEELQAREEGDVLKRFDLAHRVLLYISAIALFVGLVLGAVWADYSWGRPWGWDPKEVFALNTWLVYAILIHVPFVTRKRALWTSVLSVLGFAVMQFNWWVVNFYIVGLHSYA
jgi:ABC-type transport system involved in cytochrome c biogenesis permease subunit